MPSEPDNKMDDLLKAYAKKRRTEAGAPMEMHPATRRLLQAEAAKLRPSAAPASTSWLATLKMFWPRMAFAAGVLLVAGIAALTFLPLANQEKEGMQLAKQETKAPLADRDQAEEQLILSRRAITAASAPTARPASEPAAVLGVDATSRAPIRQEGKPLPELAIASEARSTDAEKKLKAIDLAQNEPRNNLAMTSEQRALSPVAPAAAPPAAPATSVPVALSAVLAEASDKGTRGVDGPAKPAPTPVPAKEDYLAIADAKQVDAFALSKAEKPVAPPAPPQIQTAYFSKSLADQQQNNATTRSRFANAQQAGRPTLGKAAPRYSDATVLANFVVEQNGDQLRVVDGDGSVYNGKILYSDSSVAKEAEAVAGGLAGGRRDESSVAQSLAAKDARPQQTQQTLNYPVAGATTAGTWNFRVSGTNRTLKQPVIVDGILYETAVTNSLGQAEAVTANQAAPYNRSVAIQTPLQQRNYSITTAPAQPTGGAALNQSYGVQSLNLLNTRRIQGNVRVGPTNQLPLDALRDGNPP